jgi:hypothetical protein
MAQTADLFPPIDATVEQETIGFDFGPALKAGVTITSVATITCAVHSGTDATPSARLVGGSSIVASQATGAPSAAVAQNIGNMLAGVTYVLQCVVNTSDGQKLSLWSRLPCVAAT